MPVILGNNATSRLASSLTSGATTLSVTSGDGGKFPSPSAGQWFPVTLVKVTGSLEILRCTARSGDVLTVARAQEGTSAQAFSPGDRVELRLTAAAIVDIQQMITDLADAALLDANNLSDLANPATARNNLQLGNAATATLAANNSDTTAGRVLRVGDGGVITPITYFGNLDLIGTGGFLTIQGNSGNWPYGANGGTLISQVHLPTYRNQIAFPAILSEMKYRTMINGVWSSWNRITLDGDFAAFMMTFLRTTNVSGARDALGLGSVATLDAKQACTAWVNFNGNGTVAIRDSFNVSSITDDGVGRYTVNFTTAMANANYAPNITVAKNDNSDDGNQQVTIGGTTRVPTTAGCPVTVGRGAVSTDTQLVSVQIFGGK